MEESLKLIIMTPDKEFYKGEVTEVITENEHGHLGILPNHVAMVTVLKPAITTFMQRDGKKRSVFTSSGILNIKNNELRIMCDACEWPEDIDIKRAEEAKGRAEMRLKSKDEVDYQRAEVALMRAIMRIKASRL